MIFRSLFYRILEDVGLLFERFLVNVLIYFENGELVKISVSLKRELDFQGLEVSVFLYFWLFFGILFMDGFWDGFFMILGWILVAFWLPKSMKKVIDFGIYF